MSPIKDGVVRVRARVWGLTEGRVVDVGDCDHKRFVVVGFGLDGVEGKEDGFKPCKGRWLRGVEAGEMDGTKERTTRRRWGPEERKVVRVFKHSCNQMRVRVKGIE